MRFFSTNVPELVDSERSSKTTKLDNINVSNNSKRKEVMLILNFLLAF